MQKWSFLYCVNFITVSSRREGAKDKTVPSLLKLLFVATSVTYFDLITLPRKSYARCVCLGKVKRAVAIASEDELRQSVLRTIFLL